MYLLSFIILPLCLFFDLIIHLPAGDFVLTSRLSVLFLCYIALRRGLGMLLVLLFFYTLQARAFSGLGFTAIFFPVFFTTWFFYKLRHQIYTESYLVQAVWVFLMMLLHWALLYVIDFMTVDFILMPRLVIYAVINCLFMSFFSVALFAGWDRLFDFFGGSRHGPDGPEHDINFILHGKKRSGDLL